MSDTLKFDVDGHVATLTLNRPKSYNALNNALSFALIDALKQCKKDDNIRAVVLTGAGEKAFCSGQDLKDREAGTNQQGGLGESVRTRYNPIARGIMQTEKPIICALNGVAAGAGAGIALASDYTIAADHAYLLFAFANIGLVCDTGSSYTLPALVGRRRAFEFAALGDKIPAEQAAELGLLNTVVPAEKLQEEMQSIAQRFAERPPISMRLIKRMVNTAHNGAALEQMLEMEMYCQEVAGNSKDYMEGVAAFIEKRQPKFKGE